MTLTRRTPLRRTGGLARTGRLPARRATPRRTTHPVPFGLDVAADPRAAPVSPPPAGDYESFRLEVERRAPGGRCQARLHTRCPGRGAHAHHRLRRKHPGANHPDNGRWVCHLCHDLIHFQAVGWARRHLWLLSPGHPFDPPVDCPLSCTLDHRREATA